MGYLVRVKVKASQRNDKGNYELHKDGELKVIHSVEAMFPCESIEEGIKSLDLSEVIELHIYESL